MRNPDPDPNGDDPARHPLLRARWRPLWRTLLLLTIVAVCALAFDPHPPPAIDTGWDKRNHLLAFATLALLAELAFWPWRWRRARNLLGLLAFGAFIELVQTQIPGRSGEWLDLLADGLGIVVGMLLLALALALKWGGRRRS